MKHIFTYILYFMLKSVCKNIVPDNANNYSSPQKPDRDDGDEEDDDDDDAPPVDMDNFLESGALEDADPNLYTYQKHSDPTKEDDLDANDAEIVRTRTYDIHITYDKYYQVRNFLTWKSWKSLVQKCLYIYSLYLL